MPYTTSTIRLQVTTNTPRKIVTPMMIPVGVIFTALWVVALNQGRKADALTDAYLAGHPPAA